MDDKKKPKAQLIEELGDLRRKIAELEQAGESIKESERKYKTLVESASDQIFMIDHRYRLISANKMALRLFGKNQEEIVGKHIAEVFPEEIAHKNMANLEKVLKSGTPFRTEEKLIVGEHQFWSHTSLTPVLDDDGKTIAVLGIVSDISDRKRAENEKECLFEELTERVKELNCLYSLSRLVEIPGISLEGLLAGMVHLFAQAWRYPEITCAAIKLGNKEYKTDNFRETPWRQSAHIKIYGEIAGQVTVGYLEEKPPSYEGPFLREERTLLEAVSERLGRIIERSRAEAELLDYRDHLEELVRGRTAELVQVNKQLTMEIEERKRIERDLQSSTEKLKFFAYSVAHDLKSPAIGICGLSKRLLKKYRDLSEEQGKSYCEQIYRTAANITAFVEKINGYIAAKETPLFLEEVTLHEMLRILKEEFSTRLRDRQIEWVGPEGNPLIQVDKLYFLRILRNLIDNSLKYGGAALSRIEIGYDEKEDHHLFSVSDNGKGISQKNREIIFKPFQRENTSRGIEGTGLGLTIVKEIIEKHGGLVWIEGTEKKGLTINFSLPKKRETM
jgi:PAS domain S-box-containing protein